MVALETKYRELARESRQRSRESYERSDTDGFLSQWAGDLTARKYDLQADIEADGGTAWFPRLVTVDGRKLDAKITQTRYGACWMIRREGHPPQFCPLAVHWQEGGKGQADEFGYDSRSQARLAKRGFRQIMVERPAKAEIVGTGRGLSGSAWATTIEITSPFDLKLWARTHPETAARLGIGGDR